MLGKRGFQSVKAIQRYGKVSLAQRRRWEAALPRHQTSDHLYPQTHDICSGTCIPNIADVDHEEVVAEQMLKSTNDWRHGRTVVELGVLADALKACLNCGMPLQLTHAVDIQNYGLSAIIKIPCSNTCCQYLNNVPTGKKHGRVWNANTKLAAAMVHSGLGERQVNSFLSSLNIPAVSHKTISRRQTEMGTVVQSVARESTEMALMEEIELTEKF
ncbi:uncharacterized protein LOC125659810 isoform X2 [Ostrea edulis]|uniref:uncharacterized protein LOC125659810 isoform X1 n=1 Tax=Ostrea edulis TaxID=37623 RepID=UPI0024AFC46E|nr:uncharacterized protein LOC125659810 isoform X1 [Ostrea edulis]XP_056004762.1 uncharacterized protein LOC125659810 isoform X2 [Ostrea edulis]